MSESTIAAISTPQGTGGISIVRMSGSKSFDIIKKIFKPINNKDLDIEKDNRMMKYGHIEKDGRIYDEVMGTYIDFKKVLFCKHLCRCILNGVIKSGLCFQTFIWQHYKG